MAPATNRGFSSVENASAASRASLCAGDVQLVRDVPEVVILLGDGGGAKRVGLDDVGPRGKVFPMDLSDDVGARDGQQVVVALQSVFDIGKPLAAKVLFSQVVALNHCTHRAIEDENTLGTKVT